MLSTKRRSGHGGFFSFRRKGGFPLQAFITYSLRQKSACKSNHHLFGWFMNYTFSLIKGVYLIIQNELHHFASNGGVSQAPTSIVGFPGTRWVWLPYWAWLVHYLLSEVLSFCWVACRNAGGNKHPLKVDAGFGKITTTYHHHVDETCKTLYEVQTKEF